jgi:uncharacterized cofD-like protein
MSQANGKSRLVALGGGTGLATLLSAAKRLPLESLAAVVTVTDDGGSSGRLRREFRMPPPGDVRNCLVALAEDDELLTRLFSYRFPGLGPTGGHSLGNLFMTALHQLTGDFSRAVRLAAEVLRVRGVVLPVTEHDVHLVAEGRDGRLLLGETAISKGGPPRRLQLSPADAAPLPEALAAIETADLIVLGPGSLFTSVVPNLLLEEVRTALAGARAPRVYVANLVTQPGETDGFSLAQHLEALYGYAPEIPIDVVLANGTAFSPDLATSYRASGAEPLTIPEPWKGPGRLVVRDLLHVTAENTARHEPERLAAALWELLGEMSRGNR